MVVGHVYTIWDEDVGYKSDKVYADEKSANIALQEHYTEYWICNHKAKIIKVDVISYVNV